MPRLQAFTAQKLAKLLWMGAMAAVRVGRNKALNRVHFAKLEQAAKEARNQAVQRYSDAMDAREAAELADATISQQDANDAVHTRANSALTAGLLCV